MSINWNTLLLAFLIALVILFLIRILVRNWKVGRTIRDSISIAFPRKLSKRFGSSFHIYIYHDRFLQQVQEKIQILARSNYQETKNQINLKDIKSISVKLSSPDIQFSDSVTQTLYPINEFIFLAKPLDKCYPGKHEVLISVFDNKTEIEHYSSIIYVNVTDFMFDHVSRPLFSKISSVVLGVGSFAMFMLTFLE